MSPPPEPGRTLSSTGAARRQLLRGLLVAVGTAWGVTHVAASEAWSTVRPGVAVLFRHAIAPGGGDPPGFQLGNCATQRNLDDAGRTQARLIGEAFRRRGIDVGAVWSSQWCRTRDTADLAFPGMRKDQPAFNSFFNTTAQGPAQTRAALHVLAAWQGAGVLVVVTHQVNITALTGIVPQSGEGVVVAMRGHELQVLGRVMPSAP